MINFHKSMCLVLFQTGLVQFNLTGFDNLFVSCAILFGIKWFDCKSFGEIKVSVLCVLFQVA